LGFNCGLPNFGDDLELHHKGPIVQHLGKLLANLLGELSRAKGGFQIGGFATGRDNLRQGE